MSVLNWINCKLHWHDTYSKAEDLNYDFSGIDLSNKSTDECMDIFFDLTAIRCRHCDYIYTSGRLAKTAERLIQNN